MCTRRTQTGGRLLYGYRHHAGESIGQVLENRARQTRRALLWYRFEHEQWFWFLYSPLCWFLLSLSCSMIFPSDATISIGIGKTMTVLCSEPISRSV